MRHTILAMLAVVIVAQVSPSAESVDEKQIMSVMEQMAKATVSRDVGTLAKVYHDDLIYGHSTGGAQTKAEVLATVAGPSTVTKTMTFSDTTIRVHGTVAYIRGINDIRNVVQGTERDNHLNILWVLVKGRDGWQIAARQPSQGLPVK